MLRENECAEWRQAGAGLTEGAALERFFQLTPLAVAVPEGEYKPRRALVLVVEGGDGDIEVIVECQAPALRALQQDAVADHARHRVRTVGCVDPVQQVL